MDALSPTELLEILVRTARNMRLDAHVTAAGLAIVVYDWFLTLPDEITFIWATKRSAAKWIFLIDKYTTILTILLVNLQMSGLSGIRWPDAFCRVYFTCHMIVSLLSMQASNGLVLLHLTGLWRDNRQMRVLLWSSLVLTTLGSLIVLIVGIQRWFDAISYVVTLKVCGASTPNLSPDMFAAVWGIPLLCNVLIVVATALNSLSRPRGAYTRLTSLLTKDGILYFTVIFALHLSSVLVIALADVSLIFLMGYFTWSLTTTLLTRFIINVQKTAIRMGSTVRPIQMGRQHSGRFYSASRSVSEVERKRQLHSSMTDPASGSPPDSPSWLQFDRDGPMRGAKLFLPDPNIHR